MESLEAKALLSFLLGRFILLMTLNLADCHSQIPSAGSGQGLTAHRQAARRALLSLRDSSEIHKIGFFQERHAGPGEAGRKIG